MFLNSQYTPHLFISKFFKQQRTKKLFRFKKFLSILSNLSTVKNVYKKNHYFKRLPLHTSLTIRNFPTEAIRWTRQTTLLCCLTMFLAFKSWRFRFPHVIAAFWWYWRQKPETMYFRSHAHNEKYFDDFNVLLETVVLFSL